MVSSSRERSKIASFDLDQFAPVFWCFEQILRWIFHATIHSQGGFWRAPSPPAQEILTI